MVYISKVGLLGELGDSFVELERGLNVISGASNTGKSIIVEAIDYAFGDKETNIDLSGYDSVYVVLKNDDGEVKIVRKIGESRVRIESSNPNVESGEFPIKKKGGAHKNDRFLDDWLLTLMGVEPRLDIVVTQDWKKQNFTFRTCLNSFIVKQEDIIRRESPYLPLDTNSRRAYKSGLLFLWTGERYLNDSNKEGIAIRKARRNAVQMYLTEQIKIIEKRQKELIDVGLSTPEIEQKIEETLGLLDQKQHELDKLFDDLNEVKGQLIEVEEQLSESNSLLVKYNALESQYEADLARLNLTIEGQLHSDSLESNMVCPFCNGTLEKDLEESCAEAAKKELVKLAPKIKDLTETISDLKANIAILEETRDKLKIKKSGILDGINKDLKPLIRNLKGDLLTYRQAIEDSKEADLIAKQKEEYQKKFDELSVKPEEEETKFIVMDHYQSIIDTLETEYERLLRASNYHFTNKPVLSTKSNSDFEFSIDDKSNRSQGQGYRAYLHALASLALFKSLHDVGMYPMPFLVMDSPIQTLVENQEQEVSTTMKFGLFNTLSGIHGDLQIIVAENKFPRNVDYGNANIITFSKDPQTGRYGFAKGIKDN